MAKKKKNIKATLREAKRAQLATTRENYFSINNSSKVTGEVKTDFPQSSQNKQTVLNNFTLPINEIKKDLVKNVAFAVFTVVLLLVLKSTNFGYDQLKSIISF